MQIILVRALLLLLVILVLSGCPYVSYYNSKARYLHITVDVLIIINRIYYICPLNHRYYRFVSIYWSHHLSSERRGTKTPKTTLETMIIKPKAVIKKLPWNQNCVFEIKIDLALVGNGSSCGESIHQFLYSAQHHMASIIWILASDHP